MAMDVPEHDVLCRREADAIDSGLIRMRTVRENRKGSKPVEGDLVSSVSGVCAVHPCS